MLTGKGDLIDRVVGLEAGADDYITKPFDLREVLARIRTVMRRMHPQPAPASAAPGVKPAKGARRARSWSFRAGDSISLQRELTAARRRPGAAHSRRVRPAAGLCAQSQPGAGP